MRHPSARTASALLLCTAVLLAGCRSRGPSTGETGTGAAVLPPTDMTIDLPDTSAPGAGTDAGVGTDASVPAGALVLSQEPDRAEVHPGDELGYTITLRNASSETLRDLFIEDAFPVGTFEVLETRGGSSQTDRVTWSIETLEPQEVRNIRIQGRVTSAAEPGDVLLNIVTVRGAGVPVTSASEVRVVAAMPLTGAGGFTEPIEDVSAFIREIR